MVSLEEFYDEITSICDKLFGPSVDGTHYYIEDVSAPLIKNQIINEISNPDLQKLKYLDMCAYILQNGNNVIISLN